MCPRCDDFARTVRMLGSLALYADAGGDLLFVELVGPSLAASLPEPAPGFLPPGYDPNEGPEYPGEGWTP